MDREVQARVEEQMTYAGLLEYLQGLEGQDQVITVDLVSSSTQGSQPSSDVVAGRVLSAGGTVGKLHPLSTEAPSGEAGVAGFGLPVGDSTTLRLIERSIVSATRLSVGPEITLVVIDLGGAHVLIQDDLSLVL